MQRGRTNCVQHGNGCWTEWTQSELVAQLSDDLLLGGSSSHASGHAGVNTMPEFMPWNEQRTFFPLERIKEACSRMIGCSNFSSLYLRRFLQTLRNHHAMEGQRHLQGFAGHWPADNRGPAAAAWNLGSEAGLGVAGVDWGTWSAHQHHASLQAIYFNAASKIDLGNLHSLRTPA
eukprot:1155323-Pelagomonas_calceolata.AAC.7